jgi:DNA-binding transcriptional LysR family regulator
MIANSTNGDTYMELRHLEQFVAVAQDGNFTHAAQKLNIAQSGLSASIRALEREIGADLFVRTARGAILTDSGRVLLVEARRTLAAARRAQESVAAVQGLQRGTLTIGVHPHRRKGVDLPAVLQNFRRTYPGVEIRLRQGVTAELLEDLRQGLVDVAFVIQFGEPHARVETTKLGIDSLALVCASDHPLSERLNTVAGELVDQPFLRLVGTDRISAHTIVDEVLDSAGVLHRVRCEVNDIRLLLDLVARGLGVALLAEGDAESALALSCVPLSPAIRWDTVIATAADVPASATARAFLEMVCA